MSYSFQPWRGGITASGTISQVTSHSWNKNLVSTSALSLTWSITICTFRTQKRRAHEWVKRAPP